MRREQITQAVLSAVPLGEPMTEAGALAIVRALLIEIREPTRNMEEGVARHFPKILPPFSMIFSSMIDTIMEEISDGPPYQVRSHVASQSGNVRKRGLPLRVPDLNRTVRFQV